MSYLPARDTRSNQGPPQVAGWASSLARRLRRPVASGAYNAEVDGLRFLAIAIVVIGHFMERAVRFFPAAEAQLTASPLGPIVQRPGMGVYLFFTVSGFILAHQARKARVSPLSASFLKTYFGRRILRIEPPYVILLVATWLLIALSGYTPERTHHFDGVPHSLEASLIGSIFYLHDLAWGTYPRLFPPGWSLEIEVQFYVLAPILFWAFLKAGSPFWRLVVGTAGLVAGIALSLTSPSRIGMLHTGASILQFFYFFWLGILIAQLHGWIGSRTDGLPPLLTGALGWIGLFCYVVTPNAPADDLAMAVAIRVTTVAALLAMFVSAFARGSSFRAFCGRPWIAVIGGACYSIYLTHLQVIQVMTGVLARLVPDAGMALVLVFLAIETIAVVAAGLVFYALIERTFMLKDWPQRLWAHAGGLLRSVSPATERQVAAGSSSRERS